MNVRGLSACVSESWRPGIGDPHVMGWVTVACYLGTAWLSVMVLRRGPRLARRVAVFWAALVAILLFLAVNKQLDLQTAMTAAGRCIAIAEGWYDDRRRVQVAVILGICVMGLALLALGFAALRRDIRRNALAVAGLALVVTFVLVRAVGFHDVDALIGLSVANIRLNWLLELSGLVLIAANAVMLVLIGREWSGRL